MQGTDFYIVRTKSGGFKAAVIGSSKKVRGLRMATLPAQPHRGFQNVETAWNWLTSARTTPSKAGSSAGEGRGMTRAQLEHAIRWHKGPWPAAEMAEVSEADGPLTIRELEAADESANMERTLAGRKTLLEQWMDAKRGLETMTQRLRTTWGDAATARIVEALSDALEAASEAGQPDHAPRNRNGRELPPPTNGHQKEARA